MLGLRLFSTGFRLFSLVFICFRWLSFAFGGFRVLGTQEICCIV